jgi:hypothetical protein
MSIVIVPEPLRAPSLAEMPAFRAGFRRPSRDPRRHRSGLGGMSAAISNIA